MQLLPHHENLVFPLLLGGFLLLFVAFVVATGFASSAALPFSRLAPAIKIVPNIFITRVKTGNDKRTQCANGIYRRAHYGRDGRILRGGNCNPAGKAGWRPPKRTKGRRRAAHLKGARAV